MLKRHQEGNEREEEREGRREGEEKELKEEGREQWRKGSNGKGKGGNFSTFNPLSPIDVYRRHLDPMHL